MKQQGLFVAILAGLAAFLWGRKAFAKPMIAKGEPDTSGDAGKRGRGPRGTPKPAQGGVTDGDGQGGYTVPAGWDPIRGLWISPDCDWIVEGPGWWNGTPGGQQIAITYQEGWPANAENANLEAMLPEAGESLPAHMQRADVGVLGWVDGQVLGNENFAPRQPEDVALDILRHYAPMCADVDPLQWSEALLGWYASVVDRIVRWEQGFIGA